VFPKKEIKNINQENRMPELSENKISMQLSPSAEREVKKGHPWVFDKGVIKQNKEGAAGDLAVLYGKNREYAGIGLYDPDSPIRVRVLHRGKPEVIDEDWLKHKIGSALELRRMLINDKDTSGYRLIHGENDGLPGLVLDRYAATLVLKYDTAVWVPHTPLILSILEELARHERVVLRLSRSTDRKKLLEGMDDGAVIKGAPLKEAVIFKENGILFEADPVHGQKTGFFLDQRDNRAAVEKYALNRNVLNVFSYTGGFSLYAARGGASSVMSVDISEPALRAAKRNFALNSDDILISECRHETYCIDAFEALSELAGNGRRFGMVIVDPPSFARKQADVKNAISAYQKLTRLAIGVLDRNGVLVSASCSARVTADEFYDAVLRAAAKTGRDVKIIEKTDHAADHPVGFNEGAYLKCLFLRIG
jgi:23S rRNA (cytosine1962-C5)-methyltransferase